MKSTLRRAINLFTGIQSEKFRLSVVNTYLAQSLISTLENLNDDKGKQIVVFDIGAHKGDWTKKIKSEIPSVNAFMFEANPIHENDLKSIGCYYHIGILSDSEKTADFYACGGTGDSLYQESTNVYQNVIPTKERCHTLDTLIQQEGLPQPDFIKLDTQGSELDILNGASKSLEHAKALLLECPIYPYNAGAPSMKEYIDFLLQRGFYPSRCTEIHDMAGVFGQVDIIFLHRHILDKSDSEFSRFFKIDPRL